MDKTLGGQRYCHFCFKTDCWGECLTPKDERVFIVYTGNGKGGFCRIEETEAFSKLLKEKVKNMFENPTNEWDENSREIL